MDVIAFHKNVGGMTDPDAGMIVQRTVFFIEVFAVEFGTVGPGQGIVRNIAVYDLEMISARDMERVHIAVSADRESVKDHIFCLIQQNYFLFSGDAAQDESRSGCVTDVSRRGALVLNDQMTFEVVFVQNNRSGDGNVWRFCAERNDYGFVFSGIGNFQFQFVFRVLPQFDNASAGGFFRRNEDRVQCGQPSGGSLLPVRDLATELIAFAFSRFR